VTYTHISLIFILCITVIFLLLAVSTSQVGTALLDTLRHGSPLRRVLALLAMLIPIVFVGRIIEVVFGIGYSWHTPGLR
jgi:hypothetical protein